MTMRFPSHVATHQMVLLIALFITIVHHALISIPADAQWIFLCITLLVTGIPHGALDHLVAKKNYDIESKEFSLRSFYIKYLSRILAFGILWLLFPSFALVVFLLISAFHFGETDLPIAGQQTKIPALIFQTTYGSFLLLVLLLSHASEVIPLVSLLTREDSSLEIMFSDRQIQTTLVSGFVAFMITGIWYVLKYRPSRNWIANIGVQTVAILIILIFLPLPLAFAFYFGCWHSINALTSIRDHLSSSIGVKISWMWIFRQVLPFTLLAMLGILLGYILVNYMQQVHVPLQAFIVGIALLTAPHLEVMSDMYKLIRNR